MKVLMLNQDWFAKEWREAGHEVFTAGISPHLDLQLDRPVQHVDRIIELSGIKPDRIMVYDNSAPLFVTGIEESDIPTCYYSVDTHHHWELHTFYTQIFDTLVCAQKDYIPQLERLGTSVIWMPLWASRCFEPSDQKKYYVVFVGNLDKKLNPDRITFLEALKNEVELHYTMGNFWEIFPFAEIVLNQTVKGDLNFRVFEGMMSGAMLLTEKSGNGLQELFQDGGHLVLYEKNNVQQAVELIRSFRDDIKRARIIGSSGRELILNQHTAQHRAATMLEVLEETKKVQCNKRFFSAVCNYEIVSRQFEKVDTASCIQALVNGLKCADYAIENDEVITNESACSLIVASIRYDRMLRSSSGKALIEKCYEAYSDNEILALAAIRSNLNSGNCDYAYELALRLQSNNPEEVYSQAEDFVQGILREIEGEG